MQEANTKRNWDVIIAGAGPAGCACALSLVGSGLRVALFDKADFPRDKICGDAIPWLAIQSLGGILPQYAEAFRQFPAKCQTTKTQFNYKNKTIERAWVMEAYTCAREDFDNFLFTLVKDSGCINIITPVAIKGVEVKQDHVAITDSSGLSPFTAQVVVGADGAHSATAKSLMPRKLDRNNYVASVRAYYGNMLFTEEYRNELYLNKQFFPGYFWIFPLPGKRANAGFGMLSSEIVQKKLDIKKAFYEFIAATPLLSKKFQHATQTSSLEGFGLPLGSKQHPVSGTRFLLTGDAASLIDPISGAGIGNAMLSGKLAAEQIMRSFHNADFGRACMKQYDASLYKKIGKELGFHARLLQACSKMPFLLDLAFLAGKNNDSYFLYPDA